MHIFDSRVGNEIRVAGVVKPAYPIFGVYYDLETNKLYTRPVIGFVFREFVDRSRNPIETHTKAFPVMFSKDITQMVEEDTIYGATGFLGLSEEIEPKKDTWQAEIRDFKKKVKVVD